MDGFPTMGSLRAGTLSLYTLEDAWDENRSNASCVPAGTYLCPIAWSTRFHRLMPRLLGVPGRSGILIHPGNTARDTTGCILLGNSAAGFKLFNSRPAFLSFFSWLGESWSFAPVYLSISQLPEVA